MLIRTRTCRPLISLSAAMRCLPSGDTSMSYRSLPYLRERTSVHRSYGCGRRTSVEYPLWCCTPQSDESAPLNARSPIRALRSSTRVSRVRTSTTLRSRQDELLWVV